MAVEHGYCTVEQLRAELADDGERLPEPLLEKAIGATSRAIEQWTGRRFWQDPAPVARLYRPERPDMVHVGDISTTTGLVVATGTGGSYGTTWTAADYSLEPLNADADGGAYAWWDLVVAGSLRFSCSERLPSLQVTARWGWSEIPAQVNEAAILRAVQIFKRKETPYGVADYGEFGPVRIGRQDADVTSLLLPFQRVMVA